ncbi:MAG: acylhydrolase [Lachnospiraceae bacterium]|nr:acylhydrolase [Lachnospiraceae bacterium]
MKWWKKCPLLILLIISGLFLSGISAANQNSSYSGYQVDNLLKPMFSSVFLGAKDGIYPWSDMKNDVEEVYAFKETEIEIDIQEETIAHETETCSEPESAIEESTAVDAGAADETVVSENFEDKESITAESSQETESTADFQNAEAEEAQEQQNLSCDFAKVGEEYFDDALFIGDSRTQGMFEYGGLQNRATFYCKTSLTVYDLFKHAKAFIREDDGKKTLEQALTEHQFGKIYLMLGINELGTGTHESFFEEYARAVFKIRELQPDAIIFVQSIMRVGSQKNASDSIFNNLNINIRNVEIATLEDEQNIFYLDVNEVLCDENGNLHDDWTYDQIHLKAKYYQVWKDYLLEHGILREQKVTVQKNSNFFCFSIDSFGRI